MPQITVDGRFEAGYDARMVVTLDLTKEQLRCLTRKVKDEPKLAPVARQLGSYRRPPFRKGSGVVRSDSGARGVVDRVLLTCHGTWMVVARWGDLREAVPAGWVTSGSSEG